MMSFILSSFEISIEFTSFLGNVKNLRFFRVRYIEYTNDAIVAKKPATYTSRYHEGSGKFRENESISPTNIEKSPVNPQSRRSRMSSEVRNAALVMKNSIPEQISIGILLKSQKSKIQILCTSTSDNP